MDAPQENWKVYFESINSIIKIRRIFASGKGQKYHRAERQFVSNTSIQN